MNKSECVICYSSLKNKVKNSRYLVYRIAQIILPEEKNLLIYNKIQF